MLRFRHYMFGAGPKLILTQKSSYWLDGEKKDKMTADLSNLGTGTHTIRFPNFKMIEFEILKPEVRSPKWLDNYNKWIIDKECNLWDSERQTKGIAGLDFTSIPQLEEKQGSVIQRWSKMHLFGAKQINENNIAIKVLSNTK